MANLSAESIMCGAGTQLIAELGRRGQLGMYFNYGEYRRLRRIDSLTALSQFLNDRGVPCPEMPSDVATVADVLQSHAGDEINRDPMNWVLLDPSGCLPVLFLPFWLLARVFRTR